MIRSFKHKGLKRLFDQASHAGIPANQVARLGDILFYLDSAREVKDLNRPGLELHPLKGTLKGHWAVKVSANWRVTFRFEDSDAFEVNFVDYH